MSVRLASIVAGGSAAPWEALGFSVHDGCIALANGAIDLRSDLAGLSGLCLEVDPEVTLPSDVEGVPISAGRVMAGAEHPNGALELDHVVLRTPNLEMTSESVTSTLGLELRRVRETTSVRQGFHRFPDQGGVRGCIVEVVEDPRATTTALWGVVINVADLDPLVASVGPDLIGEAKPAVQPGRSIATVRRSADLGFPLALMTP